MCMADSNSVDTILEFLKRNKFGSAEAALRSELNKRSDFNGILQTHTLDDKKLGDRSNEKVNGGKILDEDQKAVSFRHNGEVLNNSKILDGAETSKEIIVKEVECRIGKNGSEINSISTHNIGEQSKVNEFVGKIDKNFTFSKDVDDTTLDMYSWKYSTYNDPVPSHQNYGESVGEDNFLGFHVTGKSMFNSTETLEICNANLRSGEDVIFSGDRRMSFPDGISNACVELKHQRSDFKEVDHEKRQDCTCSETDLINNTQLKSDASTHPHSELWKDCSVKTLFPFSYGDTSTSYDSISVVNKKEGKRIAEPNDIKAAIQEQVDEVGRALYFGKTLGGEPKDFGELKYLESGYQKEELPKLPPVRLKSEEKFFNIQWEEKYERNEPVLKILNADNAYLVGSFQDIPIGQEINPSGKRPGEGSWFSVSQGITEDTFDFVSGFATVGDGMSDSIDYPNEYWDSDEYDDDDDDGYTRQPIEDETWFLAHEIEYPSDNERGTGHGSVSDPHERGPNKDDEDDQSFAEDSYLSGEQYYHSRNAAVPSDDRDVLSVAEMYQRSSKNDLVGQYDGQLMDEVDLNLLHTQPVWQGFVTQTNELVMLRDGKVNGDCSRPNLDDVCLDDDQHCSVRSIGVGINSDAAGIVSEVQESLVGGSSEGDIEYFQDDDASFGGSRHSKLELEKNTGGRCNIETYVTKKHDSNRHSKNHDKSSFLQSKNHMDGSFSFPPPRDGKLVHTSSGKSSKSKGSTIVSDGAEDCAVGTDDMFLSWRLKSSDSSPEKSSGDGTCANAGESENSNPSRLTNYGYVEREHLKKEKDAKTEGAREDDPGASLEDEEAAAVQEQVNQIKAQEEEFETFNLKIVHRKNSTGFEEDKNFHVVLNSVIAGRYHVTEYLGSAAFSKAIQAHDLHTGMDVCVKIIKNNKDFFDQSLDEIKLLKYVNKHDPADKYHILRLYDYFYFREHLLIVCELLKANLYEFHKFNRESGGEVYFTMPRLQSITIQCLEALQFLHDLGLMHCDLKPENILVKSYSRCEVKVIDLGSSCFATDNLCLYVQSRSYRAPEVILGLPYDKKIDIWSLGCILAELCTGNVLFQNDSPGTLLARVIGIIGPIDQEMLAKGRDTCKYFTKNHMLYERNQSQWSSGITLLNLRKGPRIQYFFHHPLRECTKKWSMKGTNRLECLIPKKSSLRHRLPMGDQGFIDFVVHLLEINPKKRPSASEALKHPWLQYRYEPISS